MRYAGIILILTIVIVMTVASMWQGQRITMEMTMNNQFWKGYFWGIVTIGIITFICLVVFT